MKKILCVVAAIAMTIGIHADEGTNSDVGPFGLGYQGVVYGEGYTMNQIALRFAPQPVGGAIVIGQMGSAQENFTNGSQTSETESSHLTLQGKFYYSLIERQNSDFYIGGLLGLGYSTYEYTPTGGGNVSEDETTEIILGFLAGVEWRFEELPELGINFELGYNVAFEDEEEKNSTSSDYEYESVFAGTSVSLGATYYF
jgi:hypothetical protein